MPELEKLVGVDLHRLLIPASFIARITAMTVSPSQRGVPLADFSLGAGAWIIQAKAIVTAAGGGFDAERPAAVSEVISIMSLTASTKVPFGQKGIGVVSDDVQLTTTYHGATMLVVIGFDAPSPASVVLSVGNLGSRPANEKVKYSNIVVTAIKQDELISIAL